MNRTLQSVAGIAAATIVLGCGSTVASSALAGRSNIPVVVDPAAAAQETRDSGYLRVETDTDLAYIGEGTLYNVRRPYQIYSLDGQLLRRVENQGGRSGEEPELVALLPGWYMAASVYGTVYRLVQVQIRPGAVTTVPEATLRDAPRVFAISLRPTIDEPGKQDEGAEDRVHTAACTRAALKRGTDEVPLGGRSRPRI
jgi:hypothetical protein